MKSLKRERLSHARDMSVAEAESPVTSVQVYRAFVWQMLPCLSPCHLSDLAFPDVLECCLILLHVGSQECPSFVTRKCSNRLKSSFRSTATQKFTTIILDLTHELPRICKKAKSETSNTFHLHLY